MEGVHYIWRFLLATIFLLLLGGVVVTSGAKEVVLLDLRPTELLDPEDAYEHVHLVAALQGLVNRASFRLYVLVTEADSVWLNFLRQPGQWLQNVTVTQAHTIESLVQRYRHYFQGVVLYDPKVPSTSMVASTIAGADDLLPICKRSSTNPSTPSLYDQLVVGGPRLPVVVDLVGKFDGKVTGSAKCDAYVWAIKEYIESGKCDPAYMGYFLDYWWTTVAKQISLPYNVNTVSNHDYFIAHKAFFWDLDVWFDQTPNDDPNQPLGTDPKTLQAIMLAAYKVTNPRQEMIHVGGFTPWAFKYVNSKHEGVPTEWQTVKILTAYNAYLDADACCINGMANAAFYQHYPLQERYVQNRAPTKDELIRKGLLDSNGGVLPKTYIMFYVGDYDSAAWVYSMLLNNWNDSARGSVPLGWAIDPELSLRFPIIFPYLYETRTPQDFFITGDSGAGYVNPTQLFAPRQFSGLPPGDALWRQHNEPYYRKFDISFTGFLINGASGPMTPEAEQLYTSFSWDGMVEQYGYEPGGGLHLRNNTPVFQEVDLPGSPADAVQRILSYYKPGITQFQVYRSVLKSATYHKDIMGGLAKAQPNVVVVDPLSLAYISRIYLGGNNNDRVSYIHDTIPHLLHRGRAYNKISVQVRNNGWNVLRAQQVQLVVELLGTNFKATFTANVDVAPGSVGTWVGSLTLPQSLQPGEYSLRYGLTKMDNPTFFIDRGNLPWLSTVFVV